MQWCNTYTHILRQEFSIEPHLVLAFSSPYSHPPLTLTLCFHSYKYNFNLRLPCWSPIYFDITWFSSIEANARFAYVECLCVCVCVPQSIWTSSQVKAQFNNSNNEFFWLNKSISKYYAFDAWIHIHLLSVWWNLPQDRSYAISRVFSWSEKWQTYCCLTHTHTTHALINARTRTVLRNFAHFSVSFCCLYAWKLGTRTHTHTAIAIAN